MNVFGIWVFGIRAPTVVWYPGHGHIFSTQYCIVTLTPKFLTWIPDTEVVLFPNKRQKNVWHLVEFPSVIEKNNYIFWQMKNTVGFEIQTWIWNLEAWPFEIWTNGLHFVRNRLKSGQKHPDFEWSGFQIVSTEAIIVIVKAQPLKNQTVWNPIFKRLDFQITAVYVQLFTIFPKLHSNNFF